MFTDNLVIQPKEFCYALDNKSIISLLHALYSVVSIKYVGNPSDYINLKIVYGYLPSSYYDRRILLGSNILYLQGDRLIAGIRGHTYYVEHNCSIHQFIREHGNSYIIFPDQRLYLKYEEPELKSNTNQCNIL